MQRCDVRHTHRTGKGDTERTVYSHVRISQRTECLSEQFARSLREDMTADMTVAHMNNTYRIGRCTQTEHTHLLPERFQDADTVYQFILSELAESRRQADDRNGQSVRTLAVSRKRVAIGYRLLKPGTAGKRILRTEPLHRQEKHYKHRVADSEAQTAPS